MTKCEAYVTLSARGEQAEERTAGESLEEMYESGGADVACVCGGGRA